MSNSTLFPANFASKVSSLDMLQYVPQTMGQADSSLADAHAIRVNQLELLEAIVADLKTLLSMDYASFWRQVSGDESVFRFVDSYLSCSPYRGSTQFSAQTPLSAIRGSSLSSAEIFDVSDLVKQIEQAEEDVSRYTFLVLLRMSNHVTTGSVTPNLYMKPSEFGEHVYNNWLFDAPMLIDICVVYGKANPTLTRELVGNVLRAQPNYLVDIAVAVTDVITPTIRVIQTELHAANYDKPSQTRSEYANIGKTLLELIYSISATVGVYPSLFDHIELGGHESTLLVLAECHDYTVPILTRLLDGTGSSDPLCRSLLLSIGDIFRGGIDWFLSNPPRKGVPQDRGLTAFLANFGNVSKLPASVKVHTSLRTCLNRHGLLRVLDYNMSAQDRLQAFGSYPLSASSKKDLDGILQAFEVCRKRQASGVVRPVDPAVQTKIQQAASQLTGILPDVGAEFATACLRHFNNEFERTLEAILTGKLPRHLESVEDRLNWTATLNPSSGTGSGKAKNNNAKGKASTRAAADIQVVDDSSNLEVSNEDVEFYNFLQRTGRVSRQSSANSQVYLNDFESKEEMEAVRRVVAGYDSYDDEYDDTFDEFVSMDVGDSTEMDEELRPLRTLEQIAADEQNDGVPVRKDSRRDKKSAKKELPNQGGSQGANQGANQNQGQRGGQGRQNSGKRGKKKGGSAPGAVGDANNPAGSGTSTKTKQHYKNKGKRDQHNQRRGAQKKFERSMGSST